MPFLYWELKYSVMISLYNNRVRIYISICVFVDSCLWNFAIRFLFFLFFLWCYNLKKEHVKSHIHHTSYLKCENSHMDMRHYHIVTYHIIFTCDQFSQVIWYIVCSGVMAVKFSSCLTDGYLSSSSHWHSVTKKLDRLFMFLNKIVQINI